MESDSESQDSDDGRRFRFEATRKDAETSIKVRGISNHKSKHYEDTAHRDKRERSKHESDRRESGSRKSNSRDRNDQEKDSRHTTKHSKHSSELRGSRREESKNTHGDPKRYRDRIRESHHKRSRERSYDRDRSHDEKSSDLKYRSKFRERHKHSRHQSRERSSQSSRTRSDLDKSRDDHRKQDYDRRHSKRDSKSKSAKDSPNRNVDSTDGENPSAFDTIDAPSVIEHRDYKDVDLSQFDVLSETDDNLSDTLDSQNSVSQSNKSRNGVSRDQSESSEKISRESRHVDMQNLDKLHKVNPRDCSPLPGSSNNNPSAVSDFSVGSTSPTTVPEMMKYEKGGSSCSEKDDLGTSSNQENDINCTNGTSQNSRDDNSIEKSSTMTTKNTEITCDAYGPVLPPQLSKQSDIESDSSENFAESEHSESDNKVTSRNDDKNDGDTCKRFIGPTLPPKMNDTGDESQDKSDSPQQEDHQEDENSDFTFGPALPPHLLQHREDSTNPPSKILGPTLPDNLQPIPVEESTVRSESEDEDGIGPLPPDHPAMQGSLVHEQLELRARRIKEEFREEGADDSNKREEWMTELPPAQSVALGLGARKFRARAGPDMSDRSCWTDVPGKKPKPKKEEEEKKYIVQKESSKALKKDESKKSRKREKSLMEIHQEKLQKKKRKEEKEAKSSGKPVRRPFDRDVDLQVNRFDQAQKKTILLKAQLLNDRFSRGEI